MLHRVLTAAVLLLAVACSRRDGPTALDRLQPCTNAEGPTDAYCGYVDVWENRQAQSGRKIKIKVVVLPALRSQPAPDPIFFLAGGPGQGAAKLARMLRTPFRDLQIDRDLVLVDQRGTGASNPLECDLSDDTQLDADPAAALPRLRSCLDSYGNKADVRLYTTPIAMADPDEIRRYLGYGKVNLVGGSYGTRAAIVYARQYSQAVRSVIIDGVAPPDMRLPLYMARDGERALQRLIAACQRDTACNSRYPQLQERLSRLFARLQAGPVTTRLSHPRTGAEQDVTIRRDLLAGLLFGALYSPQMTSLVPYLIERAEQNDFQPFLTLGARAGSAADEMAYGMHFSVVCSEDAPRIDPAAIARESANTIFGDSLADLRLKTCSFWPRATMDPAYYELPALDLPALVLSGDLDPVTPPVWGEQVKARWQNARHIIVPGAGHGTMLSGCVTRLMRQFLNNPAAPLNTDCVNKIQRPPFFLGTAGPDPLLGAKPGAKQ